MYGAYYPCKSVSIRVNPWFILFPVHASVLHAYPGFLLRILRQGADTATNRRQAAVFGNSKSVHSILDAAFSRLWQGSGLCHKRREDAA